LLRRGNHNEIQISSQEDSSGSVRRTDWRAGHRETSLPIPYTGKTRMSDNTKYWAETDQWEFSDTGGESPIIILENNMAWSFTVKLLHMPPNELTTSLLDQHSLAGGVDQVVECLPSKCEILSSNPSTATHTKKIV
jgi:hypothetical protein